ncbi:MAG: flagellar biosynthetic protein FliQ [Oscillospiraceae bacterium]|nr:flagellar biosynthetic protein FliQ [Oscillospiraceae bacterium]MBQ4310667.1 flagellar biosynthetic protein FliQ [Oscillospiraceae bacterium]MBQ5417438.1 flagellar biosynthetic protein FliQ [Oscillospiraceae bacterium]
MSEDMILQIFKEALFLVFKMAGPLLLISMLVGLVIAIIQAATQVHEQTLTFVPKAITIVVLLLVLGSFYMSSIESFIDYIFDIIAQVCRHEGVVAAAVLSAV